MKAAPKWGLIMNLIDLIDRWENSARKAFVDAEMDDDSMGKKLIEHGAIVLLQFALKNSG